jgi:hypothetical protein
MRQNLQKLPIPLVLVSNLNATVGVHYHSKKGILAEMGLCPSLVHCFNLIFEVKVFLSYHRNKKIW